MPRTDYFNEAMLTAMLAAVPAAAAPPQGGENEPPARTAPNARPAGPTGSAASAGRAIPVIPPLSFPQDARPAGSAGSAVPAGRASPTIPPLHFPQDAARAQAARSAGAPEAEDLTRAQDLKKRLLVLLDQAHKAAVADGLSPEYAEIADFAVCAFIDETLLSSDWGGRSEWMARPLQFERHATSTAGEEFYRILDMLLGKAGTDKVPDLSPPAQRDAPASREELTSTLEIFALCLAQGFTGMHYHDPDAVRAYLQKLEALIPSINAEKTSLFSSAFPVGKTRPYSPPLFFRSFDLLDWGLWLTPICCTAFLYYVCNRHLNILLSALLQGNPLP
jgi:type VI secretion system protein ImpK